MLPKTRVWGSGQGHGCGCGYGRGLGQGRQPSTINHQPSSTGHEPWATLLILRFFGGRRQPRKTRRKAKPNMSRGKKRHGSRKRKHENMFLRNLFARHCE